MKPWKFPLMAKVLAFASGSALLCAWLVVLGTSGTASEADRLQITLWQRETQTLLLIGIYFAFLAGAIFLVATTTTLRNSQSPPDD